jgi:hypothetical protein
MPGVWWWVATGAVLVLLAVYTVWMAGRIDRSHARAAAAQAALDAHLVRRAAAAAEVAEAAGDGQLRWAARVALEAVPEEREAAENDLTRVLRPWLASVAEFPGLPAGAAERSPRSSGPDQPAPSGVPAVAGEPVAGPAGPRPADAAADGPAPAAVADLVRAGRRVALARQVHNDLVRDALALRRRRLVRVLRLARKHPEPAYFDIDDPVPGRG